MYSKSAASQLKESFWTTFGRYLSPRLSSEGLRVNWINYTTGFKHLYFRMDANSKAASIAIELTHPDPGAQELFFTYFLEVKPMLHSSLGEEWEWELHVPNEHGKIVSRIGKRLEGVNVLKQEDWPQLISFLKPRILALDEFWNTVKERFEELKVI